MNPIIFWAVLLVIFLVLEATTAGLTSIWFALGAVGALISAAIAPEGPIWLRVLIFVVISGLALWLTRPFVRKHLNVKRTATNANRVLEMTGVVREDIDNLAGKGVVFVGGKLWTARAEDNQPIPADTPVEILRIEGVKLIVRPVETAEPVPASPEAEKPEPVTASATADTNT
ncbi:MAG: NfeD family protein [Oscillospiraceae bacterium]|nr:NfeD family protein [Oscillospiraceae bacterium]